MGLDYAYKLYFPRRCVLDALQGLAEMCIPGKTMGIICFPQGVRKVPFEPFADNPVPKWDDASYSFEIILNLEADEALERFTCKDPAALTTGDDSLNLGYIYFRVDNGAGQDVSKFVFIALGNRMSWAFMDSRSLRRIFICLLAAHEGICGLLDMDEWQEVFWWRGKETWARLEGAWSLEDIAKQISFKLPLR
ncbi:MAG: hypothetical protein ROW52_00175 [Anaerolineaceae bacterium]|jgi:hypothetical protein